MKNQGSSLCIGRDGSLGKQQTNMIISDPLMLNREQCLKYKERLTSFYYSNIRSCSFMDSFSYKDAELKIEDLFEHVSDGSALVFGVFDNDNEELIGYIWAYRHQFREEVRVYVNEIHVGEPYRGRGVGKQLLSAVESMAKSRGYGAIYLHAERSNEGAIHLYKSHGYEIERVQLRKGL